MSPSAVDRAYDWLRENIVRGVIETGSFIDEATVVAATGVSRTPVREAFHRLAGEQYIQLVPRRGAQVRELGAKEMYEVFSARFAIESYALQELCHRKAPVPPAMEEAMQELIDYPELTSAERHVEYGRLDIQFHRAYVEAIDNQLMLRMYDSLRPLHERSSLTQARVSIRDIRALTTAQHLEILKYLRESNVVEVTRALREHLSPLPEVRTHLPG